MSLSSSLTEAIEQVIEAFITRVSKEKDIDIDELRSLWSGNPLKKVKSTKSVKIKSPEESSPSVDPDVLLKSTKPELIALCKQHGHKCSGRKDILINRLLGKAEDEPVKAKPKSKAKSKAKTENSKIGKKLTADIPSIVIRRNKFNNYEHPESGLVFNNSTKTAIGTQNADGSIDPLTEEDIDQCNAFKFKFQIPDNLDYKTTLADVNVDELTDDEDEDLGEDELDDEVEEEDVELDEEDLIGSDDEFEEDYSDGE